MLKGNETVDERKIPLAELCVSAGGFLYRRMTETKVEGLFLFGNGH